MGFGAIHERSKPCESHMGIMARIRSLAALLQSGTTSRGVLNHSGCVGSYLKSSRTIPRSSRVVKLKLSPGRSLMISAGPPYSHAGLFRSWRGAMRRRRKSAPTSATDRLANRRRRIRTRAMLSLTSSESRSLQSLPRTMGVVRGAVKACGWSSTIQHHSARHSSHLPRSSPGKYDPFLLRRKTQEIPPERGASASALGVKKCLKRATLGWTPMKFSHICAKTAMVRMALGVKSSRWKPYVFMISQKKFEKGGQRPQWKKAAKK